MSIGYYKISSLEECITALLNPVTLLKDLVWPTEDQLQTIHQDMLRAGNSFWFDCCNVFEQFVLPYILIWIGFALPSMFLSIDKSFLYLQHFGMILQVWQLQFHLNPVERHTVFGEGFLETSETQSSKGWWGHHTWCPSGDGFNTSLLDLSHSLRSSCEGDLLASSSRTASVCYWKDCASDD